MEKDQNSARFKQFGGGVIPPLNGSLPRPMAIRIPEVLMSEFMPPIVSIFAGGHQTFLLDKQGGIWAAGENKKGQLGITGTQRNQQVRNSANQGSLPISNLPRESQPGPNRSQVIQDLEEFNEGNTVASVLEHPSQVYEFTLVDELLDKQVDGVSTGPNHTVAWSSSTGAIYVFGENSQGNLGIDDDRDRVEPTSVESFSEAAAYGIKVKNVSVGDNHTLALMEMQTEGTQMIFGWGANHYSQLGLIDSKEGQQILGSQQEQENIISVPFQVMSDFEERVQSVHCSSNYSAILTQDGRVYTWGRGDCARLGYSPPLKQQKIPLMLQLQPKIAQLGLGMFHAVALTDSGQVYTWGSGISGQLGHDKILNDVASK